MELKTNTARSILIVDDDRVTREALVHLLGRLGYHTVAAATVAEGLAKLNGQTTAILDLNLPDGLGTVILQRIRGENLPIRVAVTTGTTDGALRAEAERHQPDLLLCKPIEVNLLLKWLDEQVEPTPVRS